MTTSAWYLAQIADLLDQGFHGKVVLHIQAGTIERLVKEESVLAPEEVRNRGNGKKNRPGQK